MRGITTRSTSPGGHVFDGPYKAFRIPTFAMTLWTLAYVFLNPVKAGLCKTPEEYGWSGYRSFVGRPGSPMPVSGASVMAGAEQAVERAWARFHACVRRQMEMPAKQIPGRPTMVEVHRSQFEWLLEETAVNAPDLTAEDRQQLAMYWARQCGIAPRVMAMALGWRDSTAVRRALHRFRDRLACEPSLARLAPLP